MQDVALGKRFIDLAREMVEQNRPDVAAVLLALSGAVLEGDPHALSELAQLCADYCDRRDDARAAVSEDARAVVSIVVATLPEHKREGLRANATNN